MMGGRAADDLPVMEMASRANPRYRPTPLSSTIPVPLEMSMAAIWGTISASR
jgi:hypothetical protein